MTNEFTDSVSFIKLCYDSNAFLKIYVGKITLCEIFNNPYYNCVT